MRFDYIVVFRTRLNYGDYAFITANGGVGLEITVTEANESIYFPLLARQ